MATAKKQMLNRHLLFFACEAFHPCGCFISRFLFRKISPYAKIRVSFKLTFYGNYKLNTGIYCKTSFVFCQLMRKKIY